MGFLDKFKKKAEDVVGGNADKVEKGLEKAGDLIDKKTGGKHSKQIDSAIDKASDVVEKLEKDHKKA